MNERIQQMIFSLNDKVGVHWTNEDKIKFAQLIVLECVDICRSEDWEDQQGWGKMYAHKIQKQFGIKP